MSPFSSKELSALNSSEKMGDDVAPLIGSFTSGFEAGKQLKVCVFLFFGFKMPGMRTKETRGHFIDDQRWSRDGR